MQNDKNEKTTDENREKETQESLEKGREMSEVEKKIGDKSEDSSKEDAEKWRNEG